MSTLTLNTRTDFEIVRCYTCAVVFAIPEEYAVNRRRDHKTWFCPNGHGSCWNGKSDVEQLTEQLEAARSLAEREASRRRRAEEVTAHAERRRAAMQGVATKKAKELARVRNGVCPCCNRTFVALGRHMASQHPDYQPELALQS